MSIVALALRLSAVKALQGAATLAGNSVYDSAVVPIDALSNKEPRPFISIATEDENASVSGRDLNSGDRTINLVIEIAIAQTVPLQGEDGFAIIVADTDANLELSLAVLSREVMACLFGLGGGAWGKAFRAFTKTVEETATRRGIPTKDGQRFAARQLLVRIKSIAEPPFAKPVEQGTPFAKFFQALDSDAAMKNIASILRRSIEGKPIGWPDIFNASAVAGGYTEDQASSIGIGAPANGEPLKSVELYPGGFVVDQQAAADHLPPEQDE